jgi:uncharacterized phage protein (TIGR01671 family)
MDRKIQFRGKRIDNGEWVYGSLMQFHAGEFNKPICCIMPWQRHENKERLTFYEVDFATVGQALDKTDKRGVEIYEGDICKAYQKLYEVPSPLIIKIVYNKETASFDPMQLWSSDKKWKSLINRWEQYDFEVIGNIYDNNKLLEQ